LTVATDEKAKQVDHWSEA